MEPWTVGIFGGYLIVMIIVGVLLHKNKLTGLHSVLRCFSRSMLKLALLMVTMSFSVAINMVQFESWTKWFMLGLGIFTGIYVIFTVLKPNSSNERIMLIFGLVLTYVVASTLMTFSAEENQDTSWWVLMIATALIMFSVWLSWKKHYRNKGKAARLPGHKAMDDVPDFWYYKWFNTHSSAEFVYAIICVLVTSLTMSIIQYAQMEDPDDKQPGNLAWAIVMLLALIVVLITSSKRKWVCYKWQNYSKMSGGAFEMTHPQLKPLSTDMAYNPDF